VVDLILDLYKYSGREILMFNCCHDRLITMEKCYPCPSHFFLRLRKHCIQFTNNNNKKLARRLATPQMEQVKTNFIMLTTTMHGYLC